MKPLQAFFAEIYRIGYGHQPGWTALADLSEAIEKKLGPAAEEYDALIDEVEELRKRLERYERLKLVKKLQSVRRSG